MKQFENSKYYRVNRYSNNGYSGESIKTGFECKILTGHCEYDEESDMWINNTLDCAYDIEEYHKK